MRIGESCACGASFDYEYEDQERDAPYATLAAWHERHRRRCPIVPAELPQNVTPIRSPS